MQGSKIYVWDKVVRLSHLCYILLIPALWYTGSEAMFDWHFRLAYCLLIVLSVRIIWGFIGSHYARFSGLLLSPNALLQNLKRQPEPNHLGHSALGSYSVLIMLLLMLMQLASGLVATDDIMVDGPLREFAPEWLVAQLAPIHSWNINLLLAWIGLHILMVSYYQLFTKDKLIKPMVTGFKQQSKD